jgi:hypothetical protein
LGTKLLGTHSCELLSAVNLTGLGGLGLHNMAQLRHAKQVAEQCQELGGVLWESGRARMRAAAPRGVCGVPHVAEHCYGLEQGTWPL